MTPDWASTTPLDEGTAHVVAGGLVALYDPTGLLSALLAAVSARGDQGCCPPRTGLL